MRFLAAFISLLILLTLPVQDRKAKDVARRGTGPDTNTVGFQEKMPDQDIWNIVNYLRSLGPKPAAR